MRQLAVLFSILIALCVAAPIAHGASGGESGEAAHHGDAYSGDQDHDGMLSIHSVMVRAPIGSVGNRGVVSALLSIPVGLVGWVTSGRGSAHTSELTPCCCDECSGLGSCFWCCR